MMRGLSVLLTLAAAALIGVAVAACADSDTGGGPTPTRTLTREEALELTPPPPDPNWTARPGSEDHFTTPTQKPTPTTQPYVEVAGIQVPIPAGAHYRYAPAFAGSNHMVHQVWFGDSNAKGDGSGLLRGIHFDDIGLKYAGIEPSEAEAYAPTLDALWTLAQKVRTLSPPSISLGGVDIPLPDGSYYNMVEGSLRPEAVTYYVQSGRSLFVFDAHGPVSSWVEQDEDEFQPTLDALALLD